MLCVLAKCYRRLTVLVCRTRAVRRLFFCALFGLSSACFAAPLVWQHTDTLKWAKADYAGVEYRIFIAAPQQVRLLWRNAQGENYANLRSAGKALEAVGETPLMLMNAGIYTQDYQPAGLWIEQGQELRPLNRREGSGNFHIQPNGVLWFDEQAAGIMTSADWQQQSPKVRYALQSGPMMLMNGKINSRFIKGLSSPHKRNAACISQSGELYFIITTAVAQGSEWPSFYQMSEAMLSFGCEQALYLDGTISHYYATGQSHWFHWRPFVGMIAIVNQPL